MAKKKGAWFSKSGLNCRRMDRFCTIHLPYGRVPGVSMEKHVCEALDALGVKKPSSINARSWILHNAEFIISKLPEKLKPNRNKVDTTTPKPARQYRKKSANDAIVDGVHVSTNDFLQTYAWRRLRMEALKKHGARCQCCGASPQTGAVINVDHVKPRKLFPELALSLDNLQILCHECNHGKGNWDQTDWRPEEFDAEHVAHLRTIARSS